MKKHSTLYLNEALDCLWRMWHEIKEFSHVDELLTDTRVKIENKIIEINKELDFREWVNYDEDSGVVCAANGTFKTQCTQYKRVFTRSQLKEYFVKEYFTKPNF